jgi:hypothetical protein
LPLDLKRLASFAAFAGHYSPGGTAQFKLCLEYGGQSQSVQGISAPSISSGSQVSKWGKVLGSPLRQRLGPSAIGAASEQGTQKSIQPQMSCCLSLTLSRPFLFNQLSCFGGSLTSDQGTPQKKSSHALTNSAPIPALAG